jgi:hypothetical protein
LVINQAGFLVPLFNVFDYRFLYSKAPLPLKDARVQSGSFALGYARFEVLAGVVMHVYDVSTGKQLPKFRKSLIAPYLAVQYLSRTA